MKPVVNKDTNQGVLLKDGAIVRSLGVRVFGVFGTISGEKPNEKFTADAYANALVAIYGVTELTQAQFEVLPLEPPSLLRRFFPRKSAANP